MKTRYLFFAAICLSSFFIACDKEEEDDNGNGGSGTSQAGHYRRDYDNGYYIGYFNEQGQRHGQGAYHWNDGAKFEGAWENGQRTGQGTYTSADGAVYTGAWLNSQRSGQGAQTWPNGDKYTGSYANDQRNGQGVYTWANGNRYTGDWVDGLRTGKGEMTYSDGTYTGDWLNSQRTGNGTFTWLNGDKYEGEYLQDARTGNGAFTWNDGTTITCKWENGTPVDTDNKTFVTWALKYWYFWDTGAINPDFYASAADMLQTLRHSDDRWSSISDASGTGTGIPGTETGYGMGVRWDNAGALRVAWVHPEGTAAKQGITRGYRITQFNGTTVNQNMSLTNFYPQTENMVADIIVVAPEGGDSRSVALTSQRYGVASVLHRETIQTPTKRIGYIVLKSFLDTNEIEIINAVNALVNDNVQELILDLRYCTGGNYELLRKTASLIAPAAANENIFLNRRFNPNRQASSTLYMFEKTNNLNLNRIFALTGETTSDVGEYMILGLQPYCSVVMTGARTEGTRVYGTSSWTMPERGERLTLTTAIFENSAGRSSAGGLQPNYNVADGLDKNWGNREEAMLKQAISLIEN